MQLLLFLIVLDRGSEVHDFDSVILLVKDNVLGFNVTMHDALAVAVSNCLQDLLDNRRSIVL